MLWLWLSYRFDAEVFPQRDKVGSQLLLGHRPLQPNRSQGSRPQLASSLRCMGFESLRACITLIGRSKRWRSASVPCWTRACAASPA